MQIPAHVMFPSAISRYLVPNFVFNEVNVVVKKEFPSAISRYLVPNREEVSRAVRAESFHPLYRGTWFPTLPEKHPL